MPAVSHRWPRFSEPPQTGCFRDDLNPYHARHLAMGYPLVPASTLWTWRGRWSALFGQAAPLHVEIGSGNGFFLAGMAQNHPNWNWLGIEIRYKRVVLTANKLIRAGVANAVIGRYDAWYLDDLLLPGSVAGLYVNHPDPWPKVRHAKHRLISRWFLEVAAGLLTPGGRLCIKSDVMDTIDRVESLLASGPEGEPLPRLPLTIEAHRANVFTEGPAWSDDVETNYQHKFRNRKLPVAAVLLRRSAAT